MERAEAGRDTDGECAGTLTLATMKRKKTFTIELWADALAAIHRPSCACSSRTTSPSTRQSPKSTTSSSPTATLRTISSSARKTSPASRPRTRHAPTLATPAAACRPFPGPETAAARGQATTAGAAATSHTTAKLFRVGSPVITLAAHPAA